MNGELVEFGRAFLIIDHEECKIGEVCLDAWVAAMRTLAEGLPNDYYVNDNERSKFVDGVEKDLRGPYRLYCNMYVHGSHVANSQVCCNWKEAKCRNRRSKLNFTYVISLKLLFM